MIEPKNSKDWERVYDEAEQKRAEDFAKSKHSWAEKTWHEAAMRAKSWSMSGGLRPEIDDHGEQRYRPAQGIQAACHGREDSAATLMLMMPVLEILDSIQKLLWLCLVVLFYIAAKLS